MWRFERNAAGPSGYRDQPGSRGVPEVSVQTRPDETNESFNCCTLHSGRRGLIIISGRPSAAACA